MAIRTTRMANQRAKLISITSPTCAWLMGPFRVTATYSRLATCIVALTVIFAALTFQGQPVEAYAASLIEEAVIAPGEKTFDLERAKAAGERIRELRKGVTLGDLTIRELIDEGRR